MASSRRNDLPGHLRPFLSRRHPTTHPVPSRRAVEPALIERWYGRLFSLVDSLADWPRRFPVDSVQSEMVGRETRKLNLGDYLVFFQVDEPRRQVHVVAFIHGARRRGRNRE